MGINRVLSISAKEVPVTFLKRPTYLNSPITLRKKATGIKIAMKILDPDLLNGLPKTNLNP
jgi:hypothetical protein